jgi:steroid delta-isomerase-like uncharacterized protein
LSVRFATKKEGEVMLSKRILFTVVLGAVLVVPVAARSEDNKILVRRWYDEVWTKGDMAAVDDLLSPTYVGHAAGAPDVKGTEGIKQLVATFGTAFPDHRVTVEDIVAEGDKVAVRYTMRGTHRGEFMGIAPTNKELTWTGMAIFRVMNGKFQEYWLMTDVGRQLGLVSAQGKP